MASFPPCFSAVWQGRSERVGRRSDVRRPDPASGPGTAPEGDENGGDQLLHRDFPVTIAISLFTLVVVGLVGRRIVRNIYRGVESLTEIAQRMRTHDYEALPRYSPRGELGCW